MNDKTRFFINSIIVFTSGIVEKVSFFVVSIIVARYLSREHYGEYTTAISYATFFAVLTNIGISNALRRAVNLENHLMKEHFGNALLLKSVLAVVVYGVMFVSLLFTNYTATTVTLVLIFGLVRFGNYFQITFYSFYEALEKFILPSLAVIFFSALYLCGTIGVVFFQGDYFHLAYVRLVIVIIFLAIIAFITLKRFGIGFKRDTIRSFVENAIPFSVSSIINNFIQRINIIILSLMQSTIITGVFNNAFMFILTLQFIPITIHKILVPYLYKAYDSKDVNKIQFAYDLFNKVFGLVSFYLMLVFYLFSATIIVAIFGEKYLDTIPILKLLAFSIPFIFNIAEIIIVSYDKQKSNMYIQLIAAIINIIGNVVLIYFYGIHGAAVAVVLTYGFIFIATNIYAAKRQYAVISRMIVNYGKLVLISGVIIYLVQVYLSSLYWLVSLSIATAAYLVLVVALMIRKDDIRIIKETMGMK